MFEEILKEIKAHDTIIIHRHTRPDGDAMGSQIGLKHLLMDHFPGKNIYAVGDEAGYLSFMEGSVMDTVPDSAYQGALAMVLDCGAEKLVSDGRYTLAAKTVRIDHHIFCGQFCDVEVIDSTYESCCGLIAQFAVEQGLKLNRLSAQSLYTGMVTDSGRFRYDGTTARTLRLAATLLEQGIDTGSLFRELYAESYEDKKLRAQFLLKAQFTPRRVAYIYTTAQEVEELGISPFTASRGMVNVLGDMKGVDIWANFTESEEGILCELRSAGPNVQPIAVKYGGGGHAKACGATVPDRETVVAMLHDLDKMIGEDQ